MESHGFLPVDKPLGWTSHDVVARLRRLLGTRRVGHAGTLDPAATGVLVCGVGRATRFLDYVQSGSKHYVAHLVLGVESESADIDGGITREPDQSRSFTVREIEDRLARFTGEIDQIPPKYSAIKQDGEPLYRRVRRGERVDVPVRRVRIDRIGLIRYNHPDLVIAVDCGSGVYIRALARDIGQDLGISAYLHHLLRTRVGQFDISQCWQLSDIRDRTFPRDWTMFGSAIDIGLSPMPALLLDRNGESSWYHGRSIRTAAFDAGHGDAVRTYTDGGDFAGLGSVVRSDDDTFQIQPRIVLGTA
jgi:tRNA pseudouridine55 synthase